MPHSLSRARIPGLVLALALVSWPVQVRAGDNSIGNCLYHPKGNGGKNIIFMPGSTSLVPVVQFLGAKLMKMTPAYVLVYLPVASCVAMRMANKSEYVSGTGEVYSDDEKNPGKIITSSCTIDGRVALDMAIGDTFYETCARNEPRDPLLGDFQGPQQAFVHVVHRNNFLSTTITAPQSRVIFGCGPKGRVAPFIEDNYLFTYADTGGGQYGAQLIIGKAINLTIFQGGTLPQHSHLGDSDEADAVAASINPDATIGFVSAEIYDQRRNQLKSLAFRGYKQDKAYYPDSDAQSRDKLNVRDGHYVIQSPMHLWVALNKDGSVARPLARKMIDWMQGNKVTPEEQLPFDINEVYAQAGVVPKCAMKVMRSTDDGPLVPFVTDQPPCGCSFEAKATGSSAPPGCTPCNDNSGCGQGQICSHGFCESCGK